MSKDTESDGATSAVVLTEAEVAQSIVDEFRLGCSATAIAKGLNADGLRTTTGHLWTKARVDAVWEANAYLPDRLAARATTAPAPNPFADIMRNRVPGRGAPDTVVERRRVWNWAKGL